VLHNPENYSEPAAEILSDKYSEEAFDLAADEDSGVATEPSKTIKV
jgi:hypothetical protein